MAKYKILVIAHALKNNVVAHFGEIVDETQLTTNAADLVNQGFIQAHESEEEEEEEIDPAAEEKDVDPEGDLKGEPDNGSVDESPVDDAPVISKKDAVKNALQNK